MSLNDALEKVMAFHEGFGHPWRNTPGMLSAERVESRIKWMREELDEFRQSKDVYEQADAMIDLIYFALGTLVEMGVRPDRVFDVVHEANMGKLWPDGLPRFAPDGKVLKPSTWEDPAPKIRLAIESQACTQEKAS